MSETIYYAYKWIEFYREYFDNGFAVTTIDNPKDLTYASR